jgi:hypothetical protein
MQPLKTEYLNLSPEPRVFKFLYNIVFDTSDLNLEGPILV